MYVQGQLCQMYGDWLQRRMFKDAQGNVQVCLVYVHTYIPGTYMHTYILLHTYHTYIHAWYSTWHTTCMYRPFIHDASRYAELVLLHVSCHVVPVSLIGGVARCDRALAAAAITRYRTSQILKTVH